MNFCKQIFTFLWCILFVTSIGLLLSSLFLDNSLQYQNNIIMYLGVAGAIGFIMSIIIICMCPWICETLDCMNPDISYRYRDNRNHIETIHNNRTVIPVAIRIKENDSRFDNLPIAISSV